ncbi:MAG: gliding motility-associated C-terminal domain-containing protein [Bacteroidetes bacterium]|nr:gliding motility-associated C-terminal domain-containing protein [Bacteroidota bacterium]
MMKFYLLVLGWLLCSCVQAQQVTTVAGSAGASGFVDGAGPIARFNEPHAVASDLNGNVYIADRLNHRIRKVNASGVVSTYAGTGVVGGTDGPALSSTFNEPWGIACDAIGNVYVVDTKNYKIRKIDSGGMVTTLAGSGIFGTTNGAAALARFGFPAGIAVTSNGNTIYVSDYNTHTIRKIENGQVSTMAGTVFVSGMNDGTGATATFNHPYGLCMTPAGDVLIADEWNSVIRKMNSLGVVTTIAGSGIPGSLDGPALNAQFKFPAGICTDGNGNIFVADVLNHTIRKLNAAGAVSTYAGLAGNIGDVNGNATLARFNNPTGVCFNTIDQGIYVGDNTNQLLRKITNVSSTTLSVSLVGSSTRCFGESIIFQISPSNLSNYTIKENAIVVGSSSNATVTVSNLSAGTHTLYSSAIDGMGATAISANISITILPPFVPTVTSSNGSALCNGAALTLTAQSGSNYVWSTGATTQSIVVNVAGSYQVSVTNTAGCSGISSPFNVTVQSNPVATITATSDTICPNQSTSLTASAANSYQWSTGATSQSISVGPGSYSVTVTGVGGCTATSLVQTISAYTISTPVISPNGTVILFQGDSVLLQASGSAAYLWSNGSTGSSIYVNSTGNYSVVGTSSNGCTATSAPANVTVISSSTILTAQGVTSFCNGNFVQLQSIFPTGNQWYYNGLPLAGENAQQYNAYDDGWYHVGVWQNNAWMFSDSIRVTVLPTPDVPNLNDTSICKGSTITLNLPSVTGVTYKWYSALTGGTLLSSGLSFTSPPLNTTTSYYVEAVNSFGCKSDRLDVDVVAKALPVASFTYTSVASNGQFDVNFTCTTSNPDYITWIFGDTSIQGNISHLTNPTYTFPVAGTYDVILVIENFLGCSDTLIKKVAAGANNPAFIPTTFTPNGDGKNDIFRVRGEQFTLEVMKIYDQWGTLLFSTDASLPQWDGTVNGKIVMNGTYVYRIVVVDDNFNKQEMTGPVTVIK